VVTNTDLENKIYSDRITFRFGSSDPYFHHQSYNANWCCSMFCPL